MCNKKGFFKNPIGTPSTGKKKGVFFYISLNFNLHGTIMGFQLVV